MKIAKFRCGQTVWAVIMDLTPTGFCEGCKRPLNDSPHKVEYRVERFSINMVTDVGFNPNDSHYKSQFGYTVDGTNRMFNENDLFGSKLEAVKRTELMIASDKKPPKIRRERK